MSYAEHINSKWSLGVAEEQSDEFICEVMRRLSNKATDLLTAWHSGRAVTRG